MFLREIASSQHNAREKGKHAAVRAMLRDTRLNSISVIAGEKIQQMNLGIHLSRMSCGVCFCHFGLRIA